MIHVTVQGESELPRSQLLGSAGPISIGRGVNATIRLQSEQVSRQHAVVWVTPPLLKVQDESTNGTLAGDRLLINESAEVPLGTPIVVGSFALWFEERADREVEAPPAAVAPDPPPVAP